jgi:hypothetical protein
MREGPAAVKSRLSKQKDGLTLTLPVLNHNAKSCTSQDIDIYVVVLTAVGADGMWAKCCQVPITEIPKYSHLMVAKNKATLQVAS